MTAHTVVYYDVICLLNESRSQGGGMSRFPTTCKRGVMIKGNMSPYVSVQLVVLSIVELAHCVTEDGMWG